MYKRTCKECGNTLTYSELDEFIVCKECGRTLVNPHYNKKLAKAQERRDIVKSAFVYDSAKSETYIKATRLLVYLAIIVAILSLSIFGIVHSCSYYGTYYAASSVNYSNDTKVIHLDELDKMTISPLTITIYKYVSTSDPMPNPTSYYSSSSNTASYYIDQGYEKVTGTNYYKKVYKYKKISQGAITYLCIKENDEWDEFISIVDGKLMEYKYFKKGELKKLAKLKDIKVEK